MARAKRSGAGAFLVRPLGGGGESTGAASVRARALSPGGPERRLAAQRPAGAVRRRRGISRRTDRSAGGCADRRTLVTVHARATAARHSAPPGGEQLRRALAATGSTAAAPQPPEGRSRRGHRASTRCPCVVIFLDTSAPRPPTSDSTMCPSHCCGAPWPPGDACTSRPDWQAAEPRMVGAGQPAAPRWWPAGRRGPAALRAHFRLRWRPHRLDYAARELRQPVLRRTQAQSFIHCRQSISLRRVCGNPGRAYRVR